MKKLPDCLDRLKKNLKNFFTFIFKIGISALLLIFLFGRIDFKRTVSFMRSADTFYLLYALLLFIFIEFLCLVRWNILLKILRKDLSIWRVFVSFCGGLFFNNFLPSSIGGDIAKTVDLSLHTKDTSSIFATVVLDRLAGFIGLVLIALFSFFYGYYLRLTLDLGLFLFLIILIAILIFCLFILFNKKVFNFIKKFIPLKILKELFDKFHCSCYKFKFQKKALIEIILWSLVIQGVNAFVLYYIGLSLGIRVNIIYYLIFIPMVNTIAMLPFSIGGLGLRENAAVVLFSTVGVNADKIAAMALLNFAFLIFTGLIGGSIYGVALYNRRLQCHK